MTTTKPPTFDATNARITAAALELHRALRGNVCCQPLRHRAFRPCKLYVYVKTSRPKMLRNVLRIAAAHDFGVARLRKRGQFARKVLALHISHTLRKRIEVIPPTFAASSRDGVVNKWLRFANKLRGAKLDGLWIGALQGTGNELAHFAACKM